MANDNRNSISTIDTSDGVHDTTASYNGDETPPTTPITPESTETPTALEITENTPEDAFAHVLSANSLTRPISGAELDQLIDRLSHFQSPQEGEQIRESSSTTGRGLDEDCSRQPPKEEATTGQQQGFICRSNDRRPETTHDSCANSDKTQDQ